MPDGSFVRMSTIHSALMFGNRLNLAGIPLVSAITQREPGAVWGCLEASRGRRVATDNLDKLTLQGYTPLLSGQPLGETDSSHGGARDGVHVARQRRRGRACSRS